MKNSSFVATLLLAAMVCTTVPARSDDPGRIDAYVTPYYNSVGPVVHAGKYSAGLASNNEAQFVATIRRMLGNWSRLTFIELYVGAARLYDMGFRNEATYWFYSAQYRGRLYALLVDQKKMGSLGSPGFELYHAQDAFFQLLGPNINGFAFRDIDALLKIVRKVQSENRAVPNMTALYPGIAFIPKSQWAQKNAELNSGLGKLTASLIDQKSQIAQQRGQNGTQARFAHLTSKPFPGGF